MLLEELSKEQKMVRKMDQKKVPMKAQMMALQTVPTTALQRVRWKGRLWVSEIWMALMLVDC